MILENSYDASPCELLTPREVEIMQWTADGKTSWEVAQCLRVSEHTVTAHMKNICRKLRATNKTHAAVIALTYGLVTPQSSTHANRHAQPAEWTHES